MTVEKSTVRGGCWRLPVAVCGFRGRQAELMRAPELLVRTGSDS